MEYGCIGERLIHSFSAQIHPKLFDYKYELKEIAEEDLDAFMKAKDFKAINVTIPYKQAVIPYLDYIDDTAKKIGAVNTIVNKDGKLHGYNTDFSGLKALIKKAGIEIKDKKVLILGSGGTSKTAREVAENLGAKSIFRLSRGKSEDCITYDEAYEKHTDAQIIINTTPKGMFPEIKGTAIDIDKFPCLLGVIDAVYNPLRSELVLKAREKGIKAEGGLYMLISQAAFAAEKFVGSKVSEEKINRIFKDMLKDKENIVLIGMPSSGKTTVGKLLAQRLGREFIDTDSEIVNVVGRSIPEIFSFMGEKTFRDIESNAIGVIAGRQGTVIATGGGAILRKENVENLRKNGRLYFIDRPLDKLITTSDRPLSSNRVDLQRRYNERYSIYKSSCDFSVSGDRTPDEFANMIEEEFTK
ncbi:MAG: shikimate dehydrogenase [Clostridia bacterium]|nr:shikimate dehydrogenase [Clostridia bacterium]